MQVGCHRFAAVEDRHGDVAVTDIIIRVDIGPLPLRVFIRCIRERFERRVLQSGKDLRARAKPLADGVKLQYRGRMAVESVAPDHPRNQ